MARESIANFIPSRTLRTPESALELRDRILLECRNLARERTRSPVLLGITSDSSNASTRLRSDKASRSVMGFLSGAAMIAAYLSVAPTGAQPLVDAIVCAAIGWGTHTGVSRHVTLGMKRRFVESSLETVFFSTREAVVFDSMTPDGRSVSLDRVRDVKSTMIGETRSILAYDADGVLLFSIQDPEVVGGSSDPFEAIQRFWAMR